MAAPPPQSSIEVFFSYAHEDEALRDQLAKHLKQLERQGIIQQWHDREITAGTEWRGQIDQHLESANVILLLISADFLASDYCYDIEMSRALERHNANTARVIPVIVRDVDWQGAPFHKLTPLPTDGKAITRWTNQDEAFTNVAKGIRKAIEGIYQGLESSDWERTELNPPQNIPRSGAVQFVGRDDELNQLHSQLQHNQRLAITAIQGMGGIGKTELALQYAIAHQPDYPGGICWLRAQESDIGTQVVIFVRSQLDLTPPDGLELPDQVAYCWRNWQPGDVLVVLDNVTDYEAIAPYLPPQESRFKLLLTSRLYMGRSLQQLQLDVLSPEAALDLLRAIAGEQRIDQQLTEPQQLVEWLGYLPLGLELVGRYLASKPDLDLITLQQRLNEQRLSARALVRQESMTATHESVAAAFELSWQDSNLSDSARQLGYLLCLFALAPISWQWVEQCLSDWDSEDLEDCRDSGLVHRSLLQRVEPGIYKLHQLIREFLQAKLTQFEQADEFKRSVCRVLIAIAQTIPDTPTKDQIKAITPTVPHLAELATTLHPWIRDQDLLWAFVGIAWFYQGQGAYTQAMPWYEKCLAVSRDRLGEDHPDVATSLNNLAYLYYSQGRYSEAEPFYIQSLNLLRQSVGDEHPDVAASLNNLALLYDSQGRTSEAEPLFIQSLNLLRQSGGDEHPDVATSLNNLALLYDSQGRYNDAESFYIESLNLSRQLLGDEHPAVANSLNNLASLYHSQGRTDEAEPLYLQALNLLRQRLGDAHPLVATSLNNLAYLYHSQGRTSDAEPLYLQALNLKRQRLGDAHPDVATSLNNLAALYKSQRRTSDAEPLYLQALNLRRQLLGNEHPDVAGSLNNLAELYRSQGRYSDAEALYLQALALKQRLLGEAHPQVIKVLTDLTLLYDAMAELFKVQGRYDKVTEYLEKAIALRSQLLY